MKSSKEELDKLSKQILESQNRLQDICDGINRDQLFLENQQKLIKLSNKELESVNESISVIKQKEIDAQLNLDKVSSNNNAIIKKLNNEKHKLEGEIVTLEENIKKLLDNYNNKKKDIDKLLGAMETEYKKLEAEYKNDTDKLADEYNQIFEEVENTKKIYQEQTNVLFSKKASIEDTESKIKSQKKELDGFEKKIDGLKLKIYNLSIDEITLNKAIEEQKLEKLQAQQSIDELNNIKSILTNEVAELNKEKSDFIKAKLQLKNDSIALREKEDFIMEKFTEAGIAYN